jgi:hypothetical protein
VTVKVWDAQMGQELLLLKHAESVLGVAVSGDGKGLANQGYEAITVWDLSIA